MGSKNMKPKTKPPRPKRKGILTRIAEWWTQKWCDHNWEGHVMGDEGAAWFIKNRPGKWPHYCTKCGKYEVHHPWE